LELEEWRSLPFADLAVKDISKFVQEDQVPLVELTDIIKRSCAAFRSHEVTPIVNVGGHAILVRNVEYKNTESFPYSKQHLNTRIREQQRNLPFGCLGFGAITMRGFLLVVSAGTSSPESTDSVPLGMGTVVLGA
jgi:hypothetical protein